MAEGTYAGYKVRISKDNKLQLVADTSDTYTVDGIPANVKYFRTDFVSKSEEDLSAVLLSHIAEMVELEHGVKLDGRRYLLVLSDEEADELAAHWEAYPDVRALYVSREVLFTTEQTALFSGVEVHIIPDSYFQFELREAGESW